MNKILIGIIVVLVIVLGAMRLFLFNQSEEINDLKNDIKDLEQNANNNQTFTLENMVGHFSYGEREMEFFVRANSTADLIFYSSGELSTSGTITLIGNKINYIVNEPDDETLTYIGYPKTVSFTIIDLNTISPDNETYNLTRQ